MRLKLKKEEIEIIENMIVEEISNQLNRKNGINFLNITKEEKETKKNNINKKIKKLTIIQNKVLQILIREEYYRNKEKEKINMEEWLKRVKL